MSDVDPTEGGPGGRDRIQEIVDSVLEAMGDKGDASITTRTYSDEPILRTGADFRRERESRDASRPNDAPSKRTPTQADGTPPRTGEAQVRRSRSSQEYEEIIRRSYERSTARAERAWRPATIGTSSLPETLRELRALEHELPHSGRRQEAELFVHQARLAEDYADDASFSAIYVCQQLPTYRALGNRELRGYFAWRAEWRRGVASTIPYAYARLLAAELVNGVGCGRRRDEKDPGSEGPAEPEGSGRPRKGAAPAWGDACARELLRLRDAAPELCTSGMGPNLVRELSGWLDDCVVCLGADPALAVSEWERTFGAAVRVLRIAEGRAVSDAASARRAARTAAGPGGALAREDARREYARVTGDARSAFARDPMECIADKDAPITDEQVFRAMLDLSSRKPNHSPFFRAHPEAAARVSARVFAAMCEHCARRRKVGFVDGLFGPPWATGYTPFRGLPYVEPEGLPDVEVRLSDVELVIRSEGRLSELKGYDRCVPSRELALVLHEIDRQMRAAWQEGHQLKPKGLPKYLVRIVEGAASEVWQEEQEREARRVRIDFSQLAHIRSAAATTREALLVDEEREGYVPPSEATADEAPQPVTAATGASPAAGVVAPAGPTQAASDAAPAQAAGGDVPEGAAGEEGAETLGLTPLELAALERILDARPIDDLLGPGAPLPSVLVDSINEKLFDEVGDAVVEETDDGWRAVEDYADDVRELIGA
ncbi:TerB N-terminal domain-containing protein [Atopobiaceae bacterium LCP21S3_F7]